MKISGGFGGDVQAFRMPNGLIVAEGDWLVIANGRPLAMTDAQLEAVRALLGGRALSKEVSSPKAGRKASAILPGASRAPLFRGDATLMRRGLLYFDPAPSGASPTAVTAAQMAADLPDRAASFWTSVLKRLTDRKLLTRQPTRGKRGGVLYAYEVTSAGKRAIEKLKKPAESARQGELAC